MGDPQATSRRDLTEQRRRNSGVRGVLRRHLRTPDATAGVNTSNSAHRHTSPRRATTAIVLICLALGLATPLLLLTELAPGSPDALRKDPAVAALLTWEAGLDGSPTARAAAEKVAASLAVTTLADGTLKASRVGADGQCYYLLVPADAGQRTSGVRAGVPADCPSPAP